MGRLQLQYRAPTHFRYINSGNLFGGIDWRRNLKMVKMGNGRRRRRFWKYVLLQKENSTAEPLALLESRRAELLQTLANLKDMRPGSVAGAVFRCGKPRYHCARPEDPDHGPNPRLTYKWHGKTVPEALPTPAAVRKAEREIAEFRDYQRLGRELVEVNEKICRLRPVEESLAKTF